MAPCQHLKNLSLSGSKAELLGNDAALFYQRFASRIAESVPGGVRIRGNKVLPVEEQQVCGNDAKRDAGYGLEIDRVGPRDDARRLPGEGDEAP